MYSSARLFIAFENAAAFVMNSPDATAISMLSFLDGAPGSMPPVARPRIPEPSLPVTAAVRLIVAPSLRGQAPKRVLRSLRVSKDLDLLFRWHAQNLVCERPLGAVPGPVTSAASAGCHKLIREQNAVCVTTPDEMAELAPLPGIDAPGSQVAHGERHTAVRVLDALSNRSPRSAEDVAARAGLSVSDTQSALGLLELDGAVEERERGWVAKKL